MDGNQIDKTGLLYGLKRKKDESDDQLRARILEVLRPKNEYGSRQWMIEKLKEIVPGALFVQNKSGLPDGIIYVSVHRKNISKLKNNKRFFYQNMPVCYWWKFLPKNHETLRKMKESCELHIDHCPYFKKER